MRRLMRPALFLSLVAVLTLPALADKAKDLYVKGQDAEARQQYQVAYDLYKQAYDLHPKDLRYRAAFERLRFQAAAELVHEGQKLRADGKLDEAVANFQKALAIDPSLFIAQQELTRTLKMINDQKNPQPQAAGPPNGLEKRIQEAAGPTELAPISNVPITVKMLSTKSDVVYRTIGQLAGVNVLFDPDYTPRVISVDLNGVTLQQALEITALESKTFWRPVTSNTIFVATDNPAKRKELEQSVLKTFYLSNLSQPTELQDVVNAIRAVLDVQRVQQLLSQNALVVRGTPDQIALAEKLVDDLDKPRPEVLVDIAVMQVSRDRAKTLGFNPPTSATVTLQSNINPTNTTTGTGTTGSTGSSGANGINLNTLGNLNATDFQVTIPSANLSFLMNNSDTKLIQNPQIRALDGQKASLKIGDRVPVATGSFQPGIGGVGINPLVNTQFQYLDVGVNIDITPRVHANGEVTLKISMDVSAVTGQQNIGGISQPIIGQRKIEHEIRLKDGEANLLGGIMEDHQTQSLAGIPGLAQIPILKYLFGQTNTDHSENEIVFAIVPHIIRSPDVNAENQRAIDIGTAQTIELHPSEKPQAAPAAAAPAGHGGQGEATPAQPNQPNAKPASTAPTGQNATPGGNPSFLFDPPTIQAVKGNTFAVNLLISGAQNVYSVPVQLNYNPNLLQLVNVSNGGFLSQDGQAVAVVHREDETVGQSQITATRPPGAGGVSGQGAVVTLTFLAKASGQTPLTITRGGARDPGLQAITVNGAQAAVTIQ
ncbi:MAG TPA: cohesin domain-containing protein [Candidatus Sulfotelmatobacter sp.]|nr:cohesin domain-containing protein [Candidatus Sulfotelmatobacter sp.]